MAGLVETYASVTASIAARLEAGPGLAELPWHRQGGRLPTNVASGKAYRGINTLLLWARAQACGFQTPTWGTYRQWAALGAQVRGGERAASVTFFKPLDPAGGEGGEDDGRPRHAWTARAYSVFNAAQVDGWSPPPAGPALLETERLAAAEAFFAAIDATVLHGGDEAFYRPSEDTIHMPLYASFRSAEAYYAVLGHEHIHWTGAAQRLDRALTGPRNFRSYAAEELVAELGSAFLCATLGLSTSPRPDHAAYIGGWISLLRDDVRALPTAASLAAKATDYLVGLAATKATLNTIQQPERHPVTAAA